MKKVINGKVYDTDTAREVGCFDSGAGDRLFGWSETLYVKRTGEYFLFGEGGPGSKYSVRTGVYNTTGSKVTELYLYDAGSEDKGENLAGEGLADGESIVITRDVEADKQADVVYVLEFTTEDGNTQSFDTLHYEVAPISLKSVDAAAGATAIAFEAPQK